MNMLESAGSVPGGMGMNPMPGIPNMPNPGVNPFEALTTTIPNNSNPAEPKSSGLDVDELVKKIDAKIAELEKEEEEERKKKEAEQKAKSRISSSENNKTPSDEVANIAPTMFTKQNKDEKDNSELKPTLKGEQVKDSEISKYTVTDDQFFDDFFDE